MFPFKWQSLRIIIEMRTGINNCRRWWQFNIEFRFRLEMSTGVGQNNWNSVDYTLIFQWPIILRILIQISLWEFTSIVDRFIYLLDCIFVSLCEILLRFKLNSWPIWVWKGANCWSSYSMRRSHQNSLTAWFLWRATILRTITEFMKHGKASDKRSNSVRSSKLTGRDRYALKHIVGRKYRTTAAKVTDELNQHLNSPVSTKKNSVRSIKPNINEELFLGNLCFLLSTFRRGWSGVKITRAGLQVNGTKWYYPISPVFLFSQLQDEFISWGSPGKLTTLTAFPKWSTDVDQWWFGHPYRGILSVPSLPCMVGSAVSITWTFWKIMFIQ